MLLTIRSNKVTSRIFVISMFHNAPLQVPESNQLEQLDGIIVNENVIVDRKY